MTNAQMFVCGTVDESDGRSAARSSAGDSLRRRADQSQLARRASRFGLRLGRNRQESRQARAAVIAAFGTRGHRLLHRRSLGSSHIVLAEWGVLALVSAAHAIDVRDRMGSAKLAVPLVRDGLPLLRGRASAAWKRRTRGAIQPAVPDIDGTFRLQVVTAQRPMNIGPVPDRA